MEPERRRRRPAVSCVLCRRRKIKCNRESPCNNCVKSGRNECVYENPPPPAPRQPRSDRMSEAGTDSQLSLSSTNSIQSVVQSHGSDPASRGPTPATTTTGSSSSPSAAWDIETLKNRVRQLEGQLSQTSLTPTQRAATPVPVNIETNTTSLGGTFHIHRDNASNPVVRGVTHKSRKFGQSHWVNIVGITLFKDLIVSIEPLLRDPSCPFMTNHQRGKALARTIKAQRTPPWPTTITSPLPPKNVSDELVDCYMRTTETVYRVLHISTFRGDYDAIWETDVRPDPVFLIVVKLMFAIGAAVFDERFTLRASAIQWVYEAQTWLAEPNIKRRLTLQGLQVHILLLLAREVVDVGHDSVYISAGDLFRRAVIMGLHRDPKHMPHKSILVSEMRRRLWNTILEVCVQSSLTSGGPPFFGCNDFDTEPPGNFDDDQLGTEDALPKPDDQFTQVSLSRALRKLFPARIAIVKSLNDLHSTGTYEETLRLDDQLRSLYKNVARTLQPFRSSLGWTSSQFGAQMIDHLVQRYFLSLHVPFYGPSLNVAQTAFAFSRKVLIEASLKIWYNLYPQLLNPNGPSATDGDLFSGSDFARVTAAGGGVPRLAANQAALLIGTELEAQVKEHESLGGPISIRPDLFAVLQKAVDWQLHCNRIGETNIKGHLITYMLAAQVNALMLGTAKGETGPLLVKAAIEAEELSIPLLEAIASEKQDELSTDASYSGSLSTPASMDWDLMMTDALLDAGGDMDTMGWQFSDDNMKGDTFW
ncbi:hypothetical protein PFICI_02652 [Pestalotiopsis fici W106-1]|uniref:Zn(2)-C6 fungal-type domain-containing protein n=1 Tax=Pestalotiopsis fici (strain W106-1 / CGMCC3.15140) TaxID=1229662 RepID=W3XGR3_PESFW|nr:uncharacterized protein PFICI_02652 [Pestalotiopsis fici W106-1]ETS84627.1 hypothetical protein PFICI_02652 [Pestalotiopsis fici W106-1]